MKSDKKVCIYSLYYKNTKIPIQDTLYFPVMAGNALNQTATKMQGDDSGISISDKNLYYSELTGIYWVWKNTKHNITGCCHYRRYFTAQKEPFDYKLKRLLYYLPGLYKKRYGLIYTNNIKRFKNRILNENEIVEILRNYDVILPQQRKLKYTVEEHYRRYHNDNDMKILMDIISENSPEYLHSFQTVLKGKRLYANNMFIFPAEIFNEFMEWWFSIIFAFEKKVNMNEYTGYQQRVIGFIAERLLTTWFYAQNLNIKELPVIYFKKIKFQ